MLDDLFDYCFPILDKIGHKLDSLEDDVFEGRSDAVVRDISNAKQEIISYRKIIKPERSTLRVLERHIERFLPEELEEYFDDIVDAAERIWDLLDNFKEVIEALESTNEAVINHRQNDILRILTVFSVVLLPLTLITGVFGMNVQFPGFGTAWAFWTFFGLMAAALRRDARVFPLQALAVTLARARYAVGIGCVAVAVGLFLLHVPRAVRTDEHERPRERRVQDGAVAPAHDGRHTPRHPVRTAGRGAQP